MLERDVSVMVEWWFESELAELERRPLLWDCKREALRGLGVNT